MSEFIGQGHASSDSKSLLSQKERRALSYDEAYTCPVCRHGQISAIVLMDAFACNFCRHIFTANLQSQSIRVEDSSQVMTWRWNGRTWQSIYQLDVDLTLGLWLVGAFVVIFPPALIGLSSYLFPPLPDSDWFWFPTAWAGLTFFAHFSLVAWLLLEHYQVPFYVTCKVLLQDWFDRR